MSLRRHLSKLLGRNQFIKGISIAIRDHRSSQIPLSATPFGFSIAGPKSMISGEFEKEETPIIKRLIAHSSLFINIGANIGYYCCFAGQASKRIIAFEPHSANSKILLRNLEANGYATLAEIYPTAVGGEHGILKLYGSGTAASLVDGWAGIPSTNYTLVPVVTLDGIMAGRFEDVPTLILIDVEGAEFSVLQGAFETLRKEKKPWWVIEISILDHQPIGTNINPNLLPTYDLIVTNGYEIWTLSQKPRKVLREEIERIIEKKSNSLGTHNFLCIPPIDSDKAVSILKGD